jgi:hypothetical protein
MGDFPYLVFYTVQGATVVVVAVEYATRSYIDRIAKRISAAKRKRG